MHTYSLEHYYDIIDYDKKAVKEYLLGITDCDCDFNGDNGDEYLWEEAEGFGSNAEYCLSIAEQESTLRGMIEKFLSLWMGRDPYYDSYDVGILTENGKLFVSLAFVTRY